MARRRITSLEDNGPPPAAAGSLYVGEVMHHRLRPFEHRFVYRVFSMLVDVDRLAELDRASALLSVNRRNVVSLVERDHVDRDGETLRTFADRLLDQAGLARRAARILLLVYPRVFGYAFNPISIYFAYDDAGAPVALIYAVRNTFGERHAYVAPVEPGDISEAGIRQTRAKRFHVSPFIGMNARYHFRVLPPGRIVRLRIHETEDRQPLMSATFAGTARAVDTRALAACLVRFPFMTLKVVAAIHWQALKLWFKGARFRKSPAPPAKASYGDRESAAQGGNGA